MVLLKLPAPEAGSMLQVTPLFAGSPMALPVSANVPPASIWLVAEEMDTVMFGGGGGVPPLLQPAMTVRKSKPGNRRVRTSKLFTGPPQRSGFGTPGNFPIFPRTNFTGLCKAAETIFGAVYLVGITYLEFPLGPYGAWDYTPFVSNPALAATELGISARARMR